MEKNFILVSHADCVRVGLSMMPSLVRGTTNTLAPQVSVPALLLPGLDIV